MVLLAGCSKPVRWTAEERANTQYVLQAWLELNEAVRIQNSIKGRPTEEERTILVMHLRRAVELAMKVEDDVLNKIHPGLRARWRGQFVEGIRQRLKNLEAPSGDFEAEWLGSAMLDRFGEWVSSNYRDFRIPKAIREPRS